MVGSAIFNIFHAARAYSWLPGAIFNIFHLLPRAIFSLLPGAIFAAWDDISLVA